jgi:eukaryotic-like serine/threonine-protein kinase
MNITGPLELAPDLAFVPLAALPAAIREKLGAADGYAMTRPAGRAPSTFVDEDAAALLREFAGPSTIADAVLRYSAGRGLDPGRVLEDSYPALRRCLDGGYLVEPGARAVFADAVAVGERVAGGIVLRRVQALEDSEIYQLALDDGGLAALKVLRCDRSPSLAATFRREAAVLRHLDGTAAPRLLRTGAAGDNPWLLLEWCDGAPAARAAATLRRSRDADAGVLAMCRRIARAYAGLHARGVVHGDAHPGNLIVSPTGEVRIVDFGLARWAGLEAAEAEPPRGGVPTYVAPDHAEAMRTGTAAGPATAASELYCLAVVFYELLTGDGYLDFAVDEPELLRQIAEDPPLPFARLGRASWPEVERPLTAALAKEAAGRPASVAALERLLAVAVPPAGGPAGALDRLLDSVLADSRPGGRWFTGGVPTAPLASVAYGSAGLAVALHHVAVVRDDAELDALAEEWALRAAVDATGDRAFEAPEYELTEAITGRVTPYHRLSGIHAVQALVSHALADPDARQRALDGFLAESRPACENVDLVLGRSGTLLGASMLHEALRGSRHADLGGLTALGDETLRGIWAELDAQPPVAEGTRLRHLGIAHGWAGFLLATLRWCATTGAPRPAALEDRLDQLAVLAVPAGAGLRWPWATDVEATMPGWCNGSAGFVHLWTAADAAYRDSRWAGLAERAGWDAYVTPAIAQLCCGLSGQAYGLLELYRHTGERRWLTAATELAERAASDVLDGRAEGCISGSLHKGEIGIAVLAADLARPEAASMPFFGPAH